MKADLNLVGTEPSLIVESNRERVIIQATLIEFPEGAEFGKKSEKYIHLGMTVADAMHLLANLKFVQQRYGWPDAPPPLVQPPRSDQH